MIWLAFLLTIVAIALIMIGEMTFSTEIYYVLSLICCILSLIITLNYTFPQHTNNCICEECQPKMIQEYCPCGCGQYEIKYQ